MTKSSSRHHWELSGLFSKHVVTILAFSFQQGTRILLSVILTIIHNCALYKSNRARLIQAGVLDALKLYTVIGTQGGHHRRSETLQSEIVQSVAFLADDSDAHLFKMKKEIITDEMAVKLKEGMKTKRRVAGGWHVLELIKGKHNIGLYV
jgi:hypothetical protein